MSSIIKHLNPNQEKIEFGSSQVFFSLFISQHSVKNQIPDLLLISTEKDLHKTQVKIIPTNLSSTRITKHPKQILQSFYISKKTNKK